MPVDCRDVRRHAAQAADRRKEESVRGKVLWVTVVATLLIGAVVAGWMIRLRTRPDAAALLELLPPGAELYAVVDLEGLQSNPFIRRLVSDSSEKPPEAEYAQFLRDSGFRYQDHLKQLAFARVGPEWMGVARVEADQPRIAAYLASEAAVTYQVEGLTTYVFGTERAFRVVFLDEHRVAFTVGSDPEHLRRLVERALRGSGDSGPAGQGGDPRSLPGESELWVYATLDRFLQGNPEPAQFGTFQLGREWLQGSKTLSLRVESSPIQVEVHLEGRCDSAASAERIANWAKVVLAALKAPPSPQIQPTGPDYAPLLRAVSVSQVRESVLLEWRWDPSMLALLERDSR